MTNIQEKIASIKLIPVIKLDHAQDAIPLAEALAEGGLPVMEITFRTDAAEESIRAVSKAYPDILTGAGTVITLEQVKRAHSAGAKYIVTPGISRPVIEYCCLNNIPVYPGACTPTEIIQVMEFGLDVVKFFPSEQYGGLSTIKALSAPFSQIKFIPTGGISESNLKEYLSFQKILACGGSWMVKDDLIKSKNFKEIKNKSKEAVELIKQGDSK